MNKTENIHSIHKEIQEEAYQKSLKRFQVDQEAGLLGAIGRPEIFPGEDPDEGRGEARTAQELRRNGLRNIGAAALLLTSTAVSGVVAIEGMQSKTEEPSETEIVVQETDPIEELADID